MKKSRLYEEAAAAAAAADMTLLLGAAGYRQHPQHPATTHVFTAAGPCTRAAHDDEEVFEDSRSLLDASVNQRSPDSCFADYYSQTDADLSD